MWNLKFKSILTWWSFVRVVRFSHMAVAGRLSRLVINHQRRNEWHISNVYMSPLFFCSESERLVGSTGFPPPCLLTGCVTVSIHHPDMGALIETACLDPVSGWWHIFHSTQWGVRTSYHSLITVIDPAAKAIHASSLQCLQRIYARFHFFVYNSNW